MNVPGKTAPPAPGASCSGASLPPNWEERYDPAELTAQWPRTVAELVDVLTAELQRKGIDATKAASTATSLMMAMANYFGGRQYYLPRGDKLRLAVRNRIIWQAYPKTSIEDLAATHGLTTRHVYQILGEQRALVVRTIPSTKDQEP